MLFTPNHFEKLAKDIMRVMRTRRGLGMELHAEDGFVFHPQPFKRVIVQTFIRNFHFVFVQVACGDTVVMILRGDENLSAG
jgi:hypothetical protein